jgi:hypothetical protein
MEITEGLQKRCALLKEVHDYGAESAYKLTKKYGVNAVFMTMALSKGIVFKTKEGRVIWNTSSEPNVKMADMLMQEERKYSAKCAGRPESNIRKAIDNQVQTTKIPLERELEFKDKLNAILNPVIEYNVKIRGNEVIMQFDDFSKLIGK